MAETQVRVPTDVDNLRLHQARDLRTVLGKSGIIGVANLPPEVELKRDPRFKGKYGILGEQLFYGLIEQARSTGQGHLVELVDRPNVMNGCYVLTKILSYGPKAYSRYIQGQQHKSEKPVDELASIMKRSRGILRLFADQEQRANTTYEINFGLHQFPPVFEDVPFVIRPNQDQELLFVASPLTLMQTVLEVERRLPEEQVRDGGIHCPAMGKVLGAIWDEGIQRCVEQQHLYPAELTPME